MSDGDLQVGDYKLIECIATGNTTQVWEAKQIGTGLSVAVKLLLPEALQDAEAKKVLRAEAALGKKFDHPNLIKIYDLAIKKEYGYFSMEFLRATNVKSFLRTDRPGILTIAKDLFLAIASGLEHMHSKGMLHRDVKPDNMLANKNGDYRLIDFSLAGAPDNAVSAMLKGKKSRKIMGTRTYIAPEMIRKEPISFATDLYSLGVTFYEVVTSHPPFMGSDPNELLIKHVRDRPNPPIDDMPNLTDEGNDLILKMLAKKPADRFKTMEEFILALRGIELWKEKPTDYYDALKARAASGVDDGVRKLDSRADAAKEDRVISRTSPPPAPKPAAKPEPKKDPAPKPAATTAQQAPPQPQMPPGYGAPGQPYPQMPPGYPPQGYPQGYPGYPQQGYPGQMPPGYGQQPMPGYPQGQFPPGYPQGAQYPGTPQQGMPQQAPPQQSPPQPSAPQQSVPQPSAPQPTAPQPSAPQPSAPQPSQPKAASPQQDSDKPDDNDLMFELPPVS